MASLQKMEIKSVDGEMASMASKNTEQDSENRTALIDSRTNYRRKRQPEAPKSGSCLSRLWILLTIIFFTSTMALLAVLLWREFGRERVTETKFNLKDRYPGYFWTKEEHAAFVKLLTKTQFTLVPVNQTVPIDSVFNLRCCNTTIPNLKTAAECNITTDLVSNVSTATTYVSRRRKREGEIVNKDTCCVSNTRPRRSITNGWYHGCCSSFTVFISPNKLNNIQGDEKTIAHLSSMRQYFKTENCSQTTPCSGCTCMHVRQIVTAVIEKENETNIEDKYAIDFFEIDGCCKCMNIGN